MKMNYLQFKLYTDSMLNQHMKKEVKVKGIIIKIMQEVADQ